MIEMIKKLMKTPSVSGREDRISNVIKEIMTPLCDEVYTDPLGNLIAHKKGIGKKLMFASHMDEIGFFATYIEDSGLIRVAPVGGIDFHSAGYTNVVFENGVSGVLVPEDETSGDDIKKAEKYYIDIGTDSKKKTEKKIKLGDFAVVKPELTKLAGKRYAGRPFDNRIGCAVLIEAAKRLKSTDHDIFFVFTTQEEVGCRGALPAAYEIKPDIAIALDVTGTGDIPGAKPMAVSLGKGAAIKISDRSAICDRHLVNFMKKTAEEHKIPYQLEILEYGGTDTGSMQRSAAGSVAGAISIPTRYIHSTVETLDLADVEACISLVVKLIESDLEV